MNDDDPCNHIISAMQIKFTTWAYTINFWVKLRIRLVKLCPQLL